MFPAPGYKNEKNESTRLKALSDIAQIDISLEFDTILKQILKITCCAMKALSGTIMLYEKESNELRMVSSYGFPDNYPEIVLEVAKKAGVELTFSPSGTVLETGKHYLVPDIFKEPRTKPWYEITREIGFSSLIYNPMKDGKNVFGLLNIYWADPRIFTDDEINFATIATSQAAYVVQNARMCTKLKNSIQELNKYKEQLEENLKKAYISLYESEEKYRELFDNANYAMYVVDNEDNFLKMNQCGLQKLGYSREEVIGSNISKFVTPESLKIIKEQHNKRKFGETVHPAYVIEMVSKEGEHRWVEINTRDIKKDDLTIEIHGIARDITENIILKNKLNKYNKQQKLLCHLIEDSRGGKTRATILKHLIVKSYNAHQLADTLDLDYKTIRHHLNILSKNGIITRERYGTITNYLISNNIISDLNDIGIGTQNDKDKMNNV